MALVPPATTGVSLVKDQRRIGSMFDRIAPTYDFLNHFLSLGMDLWWRRQAVRALRLEPGEVVLDVATGTGDLALAALKLAPGARVVGVDLARMMLERAAGKRDDRAIAAHSYALAAGDALQLPFADGSFDAVMIAYGIRNVPDMDAALAEFQRVLRPGGRALILEFGLPATPVFRSFYLFYFEQVLPRLGGLISRDPEAYGYLPASVGAFESARQIGARLERAGFAVERMKPLLGGVTYYVLGRRLPG